jgi:multiple sugar transport system substrate-binding protein
MNEYTPDGTGEEVPSPSRFETPLNRRDLVWNAAKLTAAAAASGPFFMAAEQAAAAELASTSGTATADPIAVGAVNAAKQFQGEKVTALYEAALQALDPKLFSGPLFEKLTGVKTVTVEAPFPSAYSKAIAEHLSKSGAFDVIDAVPGWVPDLADRGVIAPLDDLVTKYKAQATFNDIHPLYRAMPKHKGKTWGFFDDGDMYILYYRKDIFANATLKAAYKAKFKTNLRVPQTWPEFNQVAKFITDQMAPKVYGTALLRALGGGNWYDFYQGFRANGGSFFDAKTMKAQINGAIGVKTMEELTARTPAEPPGVNKLDVVSAWALWLQGKSAMVYSWPPTGRMSENISQADKAFSFLPKSKIVGKVGYAVIPGRNGEMAGGYVKCVSADSKNPELAYLHSQWMTSPSVSLQRVMLPYALRDPYRISHFKSKEYRALWPAAKDYLIQLNNGANNAVIDLLIPGTADYDQALDRAMTGIYNGQDVKKSLDDVAKQWDTITQQRGVDAQRVAYAAYLKQLGATRKNTVAVRGQAVKIT